MYILIIVGEIKNMTTKFCLSIAHPNFNESLKRYENDIQEACEYFNTASATARTPKMLTILETLDTYITVEISSDAEVSAKSLRLFTKYLMEHSLLGYCAYHTTLFKSIKIAANPVLCTEDSESLEVSVMKNMTRLLTNELSNKEDYFIIINELFQHSVNMEPQCRKSYLRSVQEYVKQMAASWGH